MKSQKFFRSVVLGALVFGLGFAQAAPTSAGDGSPGPRSAKAGCYKKAGDGSPGPRKSVASCFKTSGDGSPGPR